MLSSFRTSCQARKYLGSEDDNARWQCLCVPAYMKEGHFCRKKKNNKEQQSVPQGCHLRLLTSDTPCRAAAVAGPADPSAVPAPAPARQDVQCGLRGPAAGIPGLHPGRAHSPRLLPDPGRCLACPTAGLDSAQCRGVRNPQCSNEPRVRTWSSTPTGHLRPRMRKWLGQGQWCSGGGGVQSHLIPAILATQRCQTRGVLSTSRVPGTVRPLAGMGSCRLHSDPVTTAL